MSDRPQQPTLDGYRRELGGRTRIPATGLPREEVLEGMRDLAERERARWAEGYASGCVYNGDDEHIAFLNEVYALNSQANPLHADVWPSALKYEAEIVAMTASMLSAEATGHAPGSARGVAGTVTSGGTESILLAMKTYRDHAAATRGVEHPRMVVPVTAHAAFDKAAQYFGIRIVHTPVDSRGRAVVDAVRDAVDGDTVVVVGSAPNFPYGVVDPVEEMSEVARAAGAGFHTDACLGGFVLPWAERLGYPVPRFDFRLPGVTSISCDTHKYGYAAKGTSVVLYRTADLRRHQYFTITDWPGGLYCSPTFAGSRPGALSAACWASLVSIGEEGFLRITGEICEAARRIREGVRRDVPELDLVGESVFVVALRSALEGLDIYRVNDAMTTRGWALNGLHRPAAIHLVVTQRHRDPRVGDRFLHDLRESVDEARSHPDAEGGMAPVYGMADTIPDRGLVAEALADHMDGWYRVDAPV